MQTLMNKQAEIVWNGVDGYVTSSYAKRNLNSDDAGNVYNRSQKHEPFMVVEIDPATLPLDDDGEPDLSGTYAPNDLGGLRLFKAVE